MISDFIYTFAFSAFILTGLYAIGRAKPKFSLLLGSLGFITLVLYYSGWIMDDAYISLRYAANLAQGYGLTFNPGQPPVEGYSNPLWTLILAVPESIDIRGIYPVKIISALFALLNFPLVYLTANQLYEEQKPAIIAVILTGLFAPFAVWAGAGLETPLFSLLILLAIYSYLSDRLWISSACLGLIALTRPEGAIFCPVVIAAVAVSGKAGIKRIISIIIPATLIIGAYLLFRFFYFGDILPNTYYAKMGGGWGQALAGISYLVRFSAFSALPLWLVLGMISVRKIITDKRKYLIIVLLIAYFAFIVSAGFDLPAFRFFANIWPLIALLCAGGFLWLTRKLGPRWRWVLWLVIIGWSAFGAYWLQDRNMNGAFAYGIGIRVSGAGERSSALAIGVYLNENAEPGDKLALIDAGLMPYYSGLETFDVWGLCNKEVAEIKYNASRGVISCEEADERIRDLFFEYYPDYVALDVTGQSFNEANALAESRDYTLLKAHPQFRDINMDVRFKERYRFLKAYPAMPQYSILLFARR